MSVSVCKGIFGSKKNCNRYSINNTPYCKSHDYFVNLSDKEIQKIREGNAKTCGKCDKWHFEETSSCSKCITDQKASRALKKQSGDTVIIPKEVKTCNGIVGKERKKCNSEVVNNTSFCSTHAYMTKYTEDELKNLNKCSTCRLYKYLGGRSTCGCTKIRRDNIKKLQEDATVLTPKPPSATTVKPKLIPVQNGPIDFEQYKLDITNQINRLINTIKMQDTSIERLRSDIQELKVLVNKK